MPDANSTRQSRHRDKLAAAGFVQVNVIVPRDRAEEIKALAAEMREAHASVFLGDQ